LFLFFVSCSSGRRRRGARGLLLDSAVYLSALHSFCSFVPPPARLLLAPSRATQEREGESTRAQRSIRLLFFSRLRSPDFFLILLLSCFFIAAALWRLFPLRKRGAEFDGLEAFERFPTPAHATICIANRALAPREEESKASLASINGPPERRQSSHCKQLLSFFQSSPIFLLPLLSFPPSRCAKSSLLLVFPSLLT